MYRRAASVMLAGACAVVPFVGSAKANDATFRTIQYHSFSQPMIYCPLTVNRDQNAQAFLCEVTLEPGEHVKDWLNAQAQLWDPHVVYDGVAMQTPHLVIKPDAVGDIANVIVTTDKRTYRILFKSIVGSFPAYTAFRYDDEAIAAARLRARYAVLHPASTPQPSPTPMSVAAEMDAACSAMPSGEHYGTSAKPFALRPARSCHDVGHTFIQLPQMATAPSDTPIVLEVTSEGNRALNYTYDAASRTYRIDGVANEYAIVAGRDRMRVQRQLSVSVSSREAKPQ